MEDFESWVTDKLEQSRKSIYDKDGFMITPKNWNSNATIHNEMNHVINGLKAAGRLLRFLLFGER